MAKLKTRLYSKFNEALRLLGKGDFSAIRHKISENLTGKKYKNSDFRILVDEKEIKAKFEKALLFLKKELHEEQSFGDYLEFGVSHGSSMLFMYQTLEKLKFNNVRLFGFDSFEGLPDEAEHDDDGLWTPGDYYAKERNVRSFLTKKGIDWSRVNLTKGWFKNTLNNSFIEKNNVKSAGVIMVDCDMYSSAKEALDFCVPLIKNKTIIFFDDWNSSNLAEKNLGEKKAFLEFLEENPQFESVDFDTYSFQGNQNGEIKLVSLKQD